jgi:phosphoribosylformylglycinamidine (FGAM) synthase-like enzyme
MSRRRTKQKKPPVKGDEIRFIGGTYKQCLGWLDTANKSKRNSKMIWVVVNDEDYDEEVHTQVWRSSIRGRHQPPVTWAEAAVQEHPEIEGAIIEMARLFASCLTPDEESMMHEVDESVMQLIAKEIRQAQTEQATLPRQTIRVVTFP